MSAVAESEGRPRSPWSEESLDFRVYWRGFHEKRGIPAPKFGTEIVADNLVYDMRAVAQEVLGEERFEVSRNGGMVRVTDDTGTSFDDRELVILRWGQTENGVLGRSAITAELSYDGEKSVGIYEPDGHGITLGRYIRLHPQAWKAYQEVHGQPNEDFKYNARFAIQEVVKNQLAFGTNLGLR